MRKTIYSGWARYFVSHHALFWANLTRLNNLLVIMNISLFFLTGLVAKGYFYTFISLACLGAVSMASIVPIPSSGGSGTMAFVFFGADRTLLPGQ
jgi:hypothetical protein